MPDNERKRDYFLTLNLEPIPWRLFMDDERFPADNDPDWKIARSVGQAKALVEENGLPYYMSLDHDMGEELTGYDFVKWLCEWIIQNDAKWTHKFYVHSQNPIGAKNMRMYLDSFTKSGYI